MGVKSNMVQVEETIFDVLAKEDISDINGTHLLCIREKCLV